MARRIESHFVPGPAGRLEAILEEPDDMTPRAAALVCHPHPLHGGAMHNRVVHRLARGLRRAGAVALRFNFRGVHLSEGVYDRGEGEVEDARSAMDWLLERYPGLPLTLAGFSFGARVALRLGCSRGEIARVIAVGFPNAYAGRDDLAGCMVPKVFIHSTQDQYGARPDLEAFVRTLPPPLQLLWIEATDHFFAGALPKFEEAVFHLGPRP